MFTSRKLDYANCRSHAFFMAYCRQLVNWSLTNLLYVCTSMVQIRPIKYGYQQSETKPFCLLITWHMGEAPQRCIFQLNNPTIGVYLSASERKSFYVTRPLTSISHESEKKIIAFFYPEGTTGSVSDLPSESPKRKVNVFEHKKMLNVRVSILRFSTWHRRTQTLVVVH